MSIGLFTTALKAIPWGDVITAAPGIVKGARNLFARRPEPPPPAPSADGVPASGEATAARLAELEARLSQLTEQHRALVELTGTLAEQNAKVVQAIDILRVRTRLLSIGLVVLAVASIAGLALSYSVFGGR